MSFVLTLLFFQVIDGEIGSEFGQWTHGKPWTKDGTVLFPTKTSCYIIRNGQPELIQREFANILAVSGYKNGFIISDTNGTYILNSDFSLVKEFPESFSQFSTSESGNMFGSLIIHQEKYPMLLWNMSTNERFFRKPAGMFGTAWMVVKKGWLFVYWSATPGFVYTTSPRIEAENASNMEPGQYPKFAIPGLQPKPHFTKTYLLKDRDFIIDQEYLASSTPVFFGGMKKGFVICIEIGIRAPKIDEQLFIGSKVNVLFIDENGQIIHTRTTHGQVICIDNNQLVILHNRDITPSPLERWEDLPNDPQDRVRVMLADFKRRSYRSWDIFLERWEWPE